MEVQRISKVVPVRGYAYFDREKKRLETVSSKTELKVAHSKNKPTEDAAASLTGIARVHYDIFEFVKENGPKLDKPSLLALKEVAVKIEKKKGLIGAVADFFDLKTDRLKYFKVLKFELNRLLNL